MVSTRELAEFITYYPKSPLPSKVVGIIKMAIIDYVAVTLAGVNEPVSQATRALLALPQGNTYVWGTEKRASVHDAAYCNAVAAHCLEWDDVNIHMLAHPSIQMLPGLFALAEHESITGPDIIMAYQVGFETGIVLAKHLMPELVKRGWFPVSVLGPVMQAAAAAYLLQLPHDQVIHALGLSANAASGARCNSGSDAKPLSAGHACASGIKATLFARSGLKANLTALENEYGYYKLFCQNDAMTLNKQSGLNNQNIKMSYNRFSLLESGLAFKAYPCCAANHTAIDSALALARDNCLSLDNIKSVEVTLHKSAEIVLRHTNPSTATEAKFSVEFCVAQALRYGELGSQHLTDAEVTGLHSKGLMAKIKRRYISEKPNEEELKRGCFPAKVTLHFYHGPSLSKTTRYPKGSSDNAFTPDDLKNKFMLCATQVLDRTQAERLYLRLEKFEKLKTLNELFNPEIVYTDE